MNLLASQWGELMTNVGDFDGRTTLGSKEAGGDGEWLVRVGTENRQHVLGHISLLGYNGNIIAPMCAGGPDEAALGDPVGVLMMEWAERCKAQGGVISPGIFFDAASGNGAILLSANNTVMEIYATGLGPLHTGVSGLLETVSPVDVFVAGQQAQVLFAGRAPGFPGLFQVNALVPAGAGGGVRTVSLRSGGKSSNEVKLQIP